MTDVDVKPFQASVLGATYPEDIPQDYDYTQYWRKFSTTAADAGFAKPELSAVCEERARSMEAFSRDVLHGDAVDFEGQTGRQVAASIGEEVTKWGNFNLFGERGAQECVRAASLLLQASIAGRAPMYKTWPRDVNRLEFGLSRLKPRDPVADFRAAQLLRTAALTMAPDNQYRNYLMRDSKHLYRTIHTYTHSHLRPWLGGQALRLYEDDEFNTLARHYGLAMENGNTASARGSIYQMEALLGAQSLRLLNDAVPPKQNIGSMGVLYEELVPITVRIACLRAALQAGNADMLTTISVRRALEREDHSFTAGIAKNVNFDMVLQLNTGENIKAIPLQLKCGEKPKKTYAVPLVRDDLITEQEVIDVAQDVATVTRDRKSKTPHLDHFNDRLFGKLMSVEWPGQSA